MVISEKYIAVSDSRNVYYSCYGLENYPVLILLHGFCEDGRIWDSVARHLAKNYHVIVPDLMGFGKSVPATHDIAMADFSADIIYILNHECKSKAIVIGHSMGGYITLDLTFNYPDRVSGAGLIHSTCREDSDVKKENRKKAAEFIQNYGVFNFVKTLIPSLFTDVDLYKNEMEELIRISSEYTSKGLLNATLAMMNRGDYMNQLSEIHCPLLICSGKSDTVIPMDDLAFQSSIPPVSYFHILDYSSHMGMLEETDKLTLLIQQFCNNIYFYDIKKN